MPKKKTHRGRHKISTFTTGRLHRSLSRRGHREKGARKILTQTFELSKEIENILCFYLPSVTYYYCFYYHY